MFCNATSVWTVISEFMQLLRHFRSTFITIMHWRESLHRFNMPYITQTAVTVVSGGTVRSNARFTHTLFVWTPQTPYVVRFFFVPMLTGYSVHTADGCGPGMHFKSGAVIASALSLFLLCCTCWIKVTAHCSHKNKHGNMNNSKLYNTEGKGKQILA